MLGGHSIRAIAEAEMIAGNSKLSGAMGKISFLIMIEMVRKLGHRVPQRRHRGTQRVSDG